ncbi:hypothetical protein [uncultured Vibrio sp.]|uniref:hypothetical protein n=1 Tax=uncultured Vibrio sp. TaxID=114054 RepID=UPI0025FCD098|nr:hypothetical protein [uncultured Vibrio sp.]
MKQKALLTVTLFFAMSSHANLIIDKNGVNERDYVFDMYQCEELSHQVQKEIRSHGEIGGTLKGAAIGSAGVAIAVG